MVGGLTAELSNWSVKAIAAPTPNFQTCLDEVRLPIQALLLIGLDLD